MLSIESLSTDVREPRTVTGSQMFPLACFCSLQRTGKALVGRLWLDVTNVMSKRSKKEKIRLPVTVHGSRTSVLKLRNNNTLLVEADRYDYIKLNVNKFWCLQIDIINEVYIATATTKIKLK